MFLALVCAIAAPLAVLFWLSGSVSLFSAFCAMVLTILAILTVGRASLQALGMPVPSLAAAWVVGVFAISLTLYVLAEWLEVRVVASAATLAAAAVAVACRQRLWRAPVDGREFAAIVLCGAVTLLCCHHSASAPATLARLDVLPVWIDYFIDGGVISSFGDPLAQGAQAIELAGVPRPFYHYASYVLPAAFAQPFDLPGLPLATSLWLPFGFFTLCAGAYVFGATLGGAAAGVAAIAALTLLPDAGDYGLRNALFSFDWHVLIRPSAACAVGIALVSLALLQRWREERRPGLLAASVALAAGLVMFRAQIFVLALPCVLAAAGMATAEFRRRWALYAGAALILLVAFFVIDPWPHALPSFLVSVHDQPGIAYAGWYGSMLEHFGARVAVPLGTLLVFPAFLGAFTLLYPVAAFMQARRQIDWMPLILLGCYAALMVLAPIPANGDATELTHRPFVLVYAVVVIWTAASFAKRARFAGVVALSAAAVLAFWPDNGFVREGPRLTWGWNYYAPALQPGLAEAAAFLRKHGKPGERFAVASLPRGWAPIEKPGWVPTDAAVELIALSGMPAYIARPYLPILERGERAWLAIERFATLEAIEREMRRDAALVRLRGEGISWYVTVGEQGPRWDAGRQLAAFAQGKVAVYRTTYR